LTHRLRLVVTKKAESQIRSAADWWVENRGSATKVLTDELEGAFNLITLHPFSGAAATNVRLAGVRRVLLRRTRFHVYYKVNESQQIVQILAFWHTSRGSGPTV